MSRQWEIQECDQEFHFLVKQGVITVGLWAHPSPGIVTGEGEARHLCASPGSERGSGKGPLSQKPFSLILLVQPQN